MASGDLNIYKCLEIHKHFMLVHPHADLEKHGSLHLSSPGSYNGEKNEVIVLK